MIVCVYDNRRLMRGEIAIQFAKVSEDRAGQMSKIDSALPNLGQSEDVIVTDPRKTGMVVQ